ncbi:glycerol-3-phosphate dehydrogenase/oxidase [Roseivirga thermotolerans]|jgi:glycerol-3-phosphate dehydrogenase|uniref:Glycerol-3-phosphate dehydrogenase n=1 Tax=Roseivirga thermotolerans TaxID=1758176 RepID=A0ABQ3I630_9BACT|nr:glycerol-3-phosphate dehydrogenase/oxidase [Roseivirga thermotolerans]GHE67626.1 glycerol-3-phosphate dehydrogenase [Roseivirga thermotolerans]
MKREKMVKRLKKQKEPWDIVVIGGGATGLGVAVDAASRGYKTLLLEQHDFAKGTSSRSTKLVHGGVRYLQQGDISLVLEALKERGLMIKNAPHLVKNQAFVIPNYEWWDGPFYQVGLKVYDLMSGKLGIGSSKKLSKEETIKYIPTIGQHGLKGGVVYYDGQFDDARMALSLAKTARQFNGVVLNYFPVIDLIKNEEGIICGVKAKDQETGKVHAIKARAVINATGVFADKVKKMDEPEVKDMIQPSQGIHLVVSKEFLPDKYAIMVPQTKDGRVMFAVPWHDKVVLGTTDTMREKPELEPKALDSEIDFILETAGQYLLKQPTRADVLSVFSGLRPLAKPEGEGKSTKEISRHHKVMISQSGLITIIGGKWTTYRKMAEDTVDNAILIGALPERKCITYNLPVYGYDKNLDITSDPLAVYGIEKYSLLEMEEEDPTLAEVLSEDLPLRKSQVVWAVRNEMARTLEDMLARRVRGLFLNARESLRVAPQVAAIMAAELGKDDEWIDDQLEEFSEVARNYMIMS